MQELQPKLQQMQETLGKHNQMEQLHLQDNMFNIE